MFTYIYYTFDYNHFFISVFSLSYLDEILFNLINLCNFILTIQPFID